jgi:hypothetical protein
VTLSGDGTHSIVAKDTDTAGNTGTSSAVVYTLSTAAQTPTLSVGSSTTLQPTDGSAIKTTFALHAGDVLAFDWNFVGHDYLPFNDFSFATVNGQTFLLGVIQSVGDYGSTGWKTFTYVAPTDGNYTVGISQFNVNDTLLNSHTFVDNVSVNGISQTSFEGTLTPFTSLGTVSITSALNDTASGAANAVAVAPTAGTSMVLLDSAPTTDTTSVVENFLGLPTGSIAAVAKPSGAEHTPIVVPISVTTAPGDNANATYATISGFPPGSVFNQGNFDSTTNTWKVAASDLAGDLTITTPTDYSGSFTLSVTATSVVFSNNTSATTAAQTISVEVLMSAPVVAISSPGGTTHSVTQTITGTVDFAHLGTTVNLYDNGSTSPLGTAIVGSGGSWATTVTLSGDGTHSIVAKDTDAAGNTGNSSAVVYTLAPIQWINSVDGNWSTASNWNTGTVPGAQDEVLVNQPVNVTFNTGSTTVDYLTTGAGTTITIAGAMTISSASNIDGSMHVQSGSLDLAGSVTGTGSFSVDSGATLEFGSSVAAGETVTFLSNQGTLKLDHSLTAPFQAQISHLDATNIDLHDNIDLADLPWQLTSSAQYTSTTGILTVSDGTNHSETFHLINYTGAGIFSAQDDGHGGTLVFDPPAPTGAPAIKVLPTISTDAQVSKSGVDGTVTFAGAHSDVVPSASFAADHGGAGSVVNFTIESVTQFNGGDMVEWHFNFHQTQSSQPMPSQVVSPPFKIELSDGQSNNVATHDITLMAGGAGSDNFVFKPGTGATIVTNFSDEAGDKIDLEQTAISNFAELQALMLPKHNGNDTIVDLGHGDNLTIANVAPSQLHVEGFIFSHI